MSMLVDCPPCQIGDHKGHYRVVRPAPEGGVGGAVCTCKGECQENAAERREKFLSRMGLTPKIRQAIRKGVN